MKREEIFTTDNAISFNGIVHELKFESASEHYVGICDASIPIALGLYMTIPGTVVTTQVTCPKCIDQFRSETVKIPIKKKNGKNKSTRFSYDRRGKKSTPEKIAEGLYLAKKAVIAAQEWQNRGVPGQFSNEMLDQSNMATRFLVEILFTHGRPVPKADDYEDDLDD